MSQALACSFSTAEGPASFRIDPWKHTGGHSRMWCVVIRVPESRPVEQLQKEIKEGGLGAVTVETIFASMEPGRFRVLMRSESLSFVGIEILMHMTKSGVLKGKEVRGENVSVLFDEFTAEMTARNQRAANGNKAREGAAKRQAAVAEEKPLMS